MKRYGNIYSKIYDMDNLIAAHKNARRDKLFYKEVKMVDNNPEKYLKEIQVMLQNKTYKITSEDYEVSTINDKGKERELWKLPYYPHRIIQWAIMLQIEKVFMEVFTSHTCASLAHRGIHYAYKLTRKYLSDIDDSKYCLKMDIKKFYPSINHNKLKSLLRRKFKDKDLLEVLDMIIDSYPTEKGVPIGSYLSQYLANFYLAYFDHWILEEIHVRKVVRYMDDIIILNNSKKFLHKIRRRIEEYLQTELKITLKENWQTFPVDVRGIDFIGYRFFHNYILLRKKICQRMKQTLNKLQDKFYFSELLTFKEWCSVNSYIGWLTWSNSWRFYDKYLKPLIKALLLFYAKKILPRNFSTKKWINHFKKYARKLYFKKD